MVKKVCENCQEEFFVDYRLRDQKCCSYKCSYEKKSTKKEFELTCKCGEIYKVQITNYKFEKGDYKKCCSRICSNSDKHWSDEHKNRLSEINKNSEKVKLANKLIGEKRKEKFKNKRKEFICSLCGKIGYSKRHGKVLQKLHYECWKLSSGGIRKGSSRGKCGWYKGYWCDSSYELVFVIYCLEHNIKIERNKKGYDYVYRDKKHIYYPDFRVNGILTEIKNFRSELTDKKLKSVNEKIDIIYRDTIIPYIKYVEEKYGKDYLRLYENNKIE